MALIRSIWTWVDFACSEYDRLVAAYFSFWARLFSRFFRSSNIRKDTQSVSSIFSDWLVSRAFAVKEWPVWQRYLGSLVAASSQRTPPQFGQLYGTCPPKLLTCATSLKTRSA